MRRRTDVATPDPADRLFDVLPEDFTRERNALARELAASGRDDDAKRVRKMRRPTTAVWALNALARRETDAMREYLAAGKRLRDAHRRAIAAGEGGPLREAMRDEHRLGTDLLGRAERRLTGAGMSATSSTLDAIRTTLAAAVREGGDAEERLREGRLEALLDPAAVPAAKAKPRRRLSAKERRAEAAKAKRDAARRRREEAKRAREAKRKERLARKARTDAEALLARAEAARRRAERLEEEAREWTSP